MSVESGEVLKGKVTGITNFGAFVELPDGSSEWSTYRRFQTRLLRISGNYLRRTRK
ncbi:MAG: S1 RNA-binding domain-containing protein [Acutalibacteraceae bacterium]